MSTRWIPRGPSCVTNAQLNFSTQDIDGLGRGVCAGRVSAIALSPDGKTIYAGAASGGVWRSRDDGAHWTPLMDAQPTLAVGSLAVAGDGTVYVGTGEYNNTNTGAGIMTGVGILRSTNQGQSWQLIPPPDPSGTDDLVRTRIARIVVNPARPNEIYAATSKGLFVSTDRVEPGMKSFHLFTLGGASKSGCTDVAVDFTDPDAPIVYAAFLETGIFKVVGAPNNSTLPIDARFPFGTPIPASAFDRAIDMQWVWQITLAIAEVDTNILYAAFADDTDLLGVFRTLDGGQQWRDFDSGAFGQTGMADYLTTLAVDHRDAHKVFFGDTRLWRRVQGRSWTIVSAKRGDYPGVHDDQHALAFDRTDANIVWLGNDGGIYKSIDGGEHFEARNRGLANLQLYSLAQFRGEPGPLFGGTQDNGAIATRGHAAWRQAAGSDAYFTVIERPRPYVWYFGASPVRDPVVRFPRSDEQLRAYDRLDKGLPTPPITPVPMVFVADPNVAGRLYLGGTDTLHTWRDKDASRWSEIAVTTDGGVIRSIAVAPSDSNVVYYGRTDGRVHRIEHAGGEWRAPVTATVVTLALSSDERCVDIVVDPNDPDHFYVAIGTGDGPDSDDESIIHRIHEGRHAGGALTLTPMDPLPDVTIGLVTVPSPINHVNALALDPAHPGVVFAGTDYGVYRWSGTQWDRFSDGLPAAAVVTELLLDESRRLRAGTLGRGAWEVLLAASDRSVDIYVRDCMLDDGTQPTLSARQNPVTLGVMHWNDGVDIKLDTERMLIGGFASLSTVNYDGSGGVDYLGFESLDSDRPRGRAESRVYVQVHNRGPDPCDVVDVRLFWAFKGASGYPDLPAQFWDRHLGDTFDTTHWKPLGGAQKIIRLEPGTPRVARFDWTASGSNDTIGILAVIGSPDDPLPVLPLAVEDAVRADKHVALREVVVNPASYKLVIAVLGALALVTTVVIVAARD